MNESGKAIKKLTTHYSPAKVFKKNLGGQELQTTNLIIVHDDIDLPLGKLKIVKNRGSAGHKGVESIINNIGNKGLIRFKMGIQPIKGKPENLQNLVIKKFTKEEQEIVNTTITKIAEALDFFIENGLEKTMNQYN